MLMYFALREWAQHWDPTSDFENLLTSRKFQKHAMRIIDAGEVTTEHLEIPRVIDPIGFTTLPAKQLKARGPFSKTTVTEYFQKQHEICLRGSLPCLFTLDSQNNFSFHPLETLIFRPSNESLRLSRKRKYIATIDADDEEEGLTFCLRSAKTAIRLRIVDLD